MCELTRDPDFLIFLERSKIHTRQRNEVLTNSGIQLMDGPFHRWPWTRQGPADCPVQSFEKNTKDVIPQVLGNGRFAARLEF